MPVWARGVGGRRQAHCVERERRKASNVSHILRIERVLGGQRGAMGEDACDTRATVPRAQ